MKLFQKNKKCDDGITDQKKKKESEICEYLRNLWFKINNRIMGKTYGKFGRLKPNPDLYPDELVNARLRARTSKKHLHLAHFRLA